MNPFDEHTQDIGPARDTWEAFASAQGGTCRLIRSHDHCYNRLLVTLPRPGHELCFEASDKQTWHAWAQGPCASALAFSLSPRALGDRILNLLVPEPARFLNPDLHRKLVLAGPGARAARGLLEGEHLHPLLALCPSFYLNLQEKPDGFELRLVPDPGCSFEQGATVVVVLLDGLLARLQGAGLIRASYSYCGACLVPMEVPMTAPSRVTGLER